MTWDTSEVDIDLYAFDGSGHIAYYGDRYAIPDTDLSADNTFGYGPETFTESSNTGRPYAFGVCMYSGSKPTVVTLTVIDPSGTSRQFTRQLSGPGDSSLVTTSPSASNVSIPSSWCRSGGSGGGTGDS